MIVCLWDCVEYFSLVAWGLLACRRELKRQTEILVSLPEHPPLPPSWLTDTYLVDKRSSCCELSVSTPSGCDVETGLAANWSSTSIPFSSATCTRNKNRTLASLKEISMSFILGTIEFLNAQLPPQGISLTKCWRRPHSVTVWETMTILERFVPVSWAIQLGPGVWWGWWPCSCWSPSLVCAHPDPQTGPQTFPWWRRSMSV